MKPYDVGLICGRFQTFHKGHEKLVETGLLLCDRLLILVGSSQECGTERNPLNINTRTKMLKAVYGDDPNIMIYGLPDLTNENDIRPEWGRYLLANADNCDARLSALAQASVVYGYYAKNLFDVV
jgi:cytidyltransferase-like protein